VNELDFLKLFQSQQDPSLLGQGPLLIPMQSRQTNPLPVTEAEMAKPRRLIEPKAAAPTAADPYLRQEIVASKMFSPEEEALHRDLRSKFKQSVVEGEASTQALRDMIQSTMAQDAGKIDWTPAAALAKAWGGPDVTEAVQRQGPMSAEDKLKMRAQLEKIAGDQSSKTLSEIGDYLGKVQSGRFQVEAARESSKQGRFQAGQDLKKEDSLRQDIAKNVVNPLLEEKQKMGVMETALASGDYQMLSNTLSQYSRSISGEKGVLTDHDISRVFPANMNMTMAKVNAYFSSTPTAQIPPEMTASMQKLIEVTKQKLAEKYKTQLDTKKKIYSSGAYADLMQPGKVGSTIFSEGEGILGEFAPKAAPKGDTLGNEFDAWKKAKGY